MDLIAEWDVVVVGLANLNLKELGRLARRQHIIFSNMQRRRI